MTRKNVERSLRDQKSFFLCKEKDLHKILFTGDIKAL